MTVSEVVKAFGGTSRMAALFDVTPPAVSNWKAAGRFPPRLHYRIAKEAERLDIEINEKLFAA